jgi:hypothetical protein
LSDFSCGVTLQFSDAGGVAHTRFCLACVTAEQHIEREAEGGSRIELSRAADRRPLCQNADRQ